MSTPHPYHTNPTNGAPAVNQESTTEPIAIIGIGCRFPGNANSPESFWQLLKDGVDAITKIPEDRWKINSFYDPDPSKPGKTYAQWGGFIHEIDKFDADFFGISPKEASRMDPQQRLILEVAYEAIEDAGLDLKKITGTDTGVFIGISTCDYGAIQANPSERKTINAYTNLGIGVCIAANRVSYQFDFHGPSFAVDTACSSSLVATHLACQSIWNGESSMALVGGVNAILKPEGTIGFTKATMLSPDGRCKSFDANANGYVRSEGAGIVVLKSLSKAIADKDPIYAVIRGTAINQDGRTAGIALPNQKAQEAVLMEAYQKAGLDPKNVGYVETHGTGTVVGDPIEVNALGAILSINRNADNECFIGSVKTNIGHLESASGIAGLIKAALCLKHQQIAPNLHFETPNPNIDFAELGFRVPKNLEPLTTNGSSTSFLAGINSFGFGGANAHVILSMFPTRDNGHPVNIATRLEAEQNLILPLSARSPEALKAYSRSYIEFLTNHKEISIPDVCNSASLRKTHHDIRLAVVGSNREEMIDQLEAFLNDETRLTMSSGRAASTQDQKMVFVFSGMGPQWWAMGNELLKTEPVFLHTIEKIDLLLKQYVDWSLLTELTAPEEKSRIQETYIAQPAIFALQTALYAVWQSWGIKPDLILGHSVGEIAAAHAAGVLSLEDAVKIIFHRSRLQHTTAGQGKMLAVGLSVAESQELIKEYGDSVSIGAINSPADVTLSGDADILESIAKSLDKKGVFCKFLQVPVPYHSSKMDQIKNEFMESLQGLSPKTAVIPYFSTVTTQSVTGPELDVNYWWLNVRSTVQFAPLIESLTDSGYHLFLEISAHPVLATSIHACLHKKNIEGTVLSSLRRQQPERSGMLGTFGKLYAIGYPIQWNRLYEQTDRFVKLPAYPWQKEHFWQETDKSVQKRIGQKIHPLLGYSKNTAYHTWENQINKQELFYLKDHSIQGSIIYPAAGYVEMAFAVARETFGPGPCAVEEIELHKALFLAEEPSTVHFIHDSKNNNFEVFSLSNPADNTWIRNVSGKIRPLKESYTSKILPYTPAQSLEKEIPKTRFYDLFWRGGLQYGPNFQPIELLWTNDQEAAAIIKTADDITADLGEYIIHPTLIDGCFQVLLGTVGFRDYTELEKETLEKIFLPVSIDKIEFLKQPGKECTAHAVLTMLKPDQVQGNITLTDSQGIIFMRVVGLRCIAIDKSNTSIESYLYKYKWKLKEQKSQVIKNNSTQYIPSLLQIESELKKEAERLFAKMDRKKYYEIFDRKANQLATDYILFALGNLQWNLKAGEQFTLESIIQESGIAPEHKQLFNRLLHYLSEEGLIKKENDYWEVCKEFIAKDIHQLREDWKNLWLEFPSNHTEMTLFQSCAEKLSEVLRGTVNPLELIFPNGSMAATEHLYQNAPSYEIYNLLARRSVLAAIEHIPIGQTIRVLELGGGTGGMTTYTLQALPHSRTEYVFTDISTIFLKHAEQKFNSYPFIRYQVLDIEHDPLEQGFEPHSFDLIFASDVLHATADLRKTLRHVKLLLASEGLLVILEGNKMRSMVTLIFGLLKGWWLFNDDDLRNLDPWISMEEWKNLLIDSGFTETTGVTETPQPDLSLHCVVLAKGPVVHPAVQVSQAPAPTELQGNWLIFSDKHGIGQTLVENLAGIGCSPVMIQPGDSFSRTDEMHYQIRPEDQDDYRQLITTLRETMDGDIKGIIHLWNIDSPSSDTLSLASLDESLDPNCLSIIYLFQVLQESNTTNLPGLWLVTSGAELVDSTDMIQLSQSLVWGLGRVMINEFQILNLKLVDLGKQNINENISTLWEEILSGDQDEEVAIRKGARYVHRLVRTSLNSIAIDAQEYSPEKTTNTFKLEIANPGILEHLKLMSANRVPPAAGEVEIKVHVAALNFKDIMIAMGLLPPEALEGGYTGKDLGMECSGIIVAKGADVKEFEIGDAVITCGPGTLRSYLTIASDFVVRKPSHLSFEEAATIPIAFLTAYYSLHHLARIGKGDKILIHSATGGVGLAAIQIALHAGAEVFATAGTPEKRNLLQTLGIRYVMDSRSLAFEAEILNFTNGKGVDIVLNSLAGEAIHKSIKVLSSYGRFIEIGKRDIYENNKVELKPFRNNLSYFAVDLDKMCAQRPEMIKSMIREIMQNFARLPVENGSNHKPSAFSPLPYRTFSINDVAGGFKYMTQAKHIGKVLIAIDGQQAQVTPTPAKSLPIHADGTYVVTGGLGGFGLEVSHWLIEHGARHLVLVGRSGASSEKALAALNAMRDKGVEVIAAQADVTIEEDVRNILAGIRKSMPPLRGIIHAAMVIKDGLMLHVNADAVRKVVSPKALGAWNLHLQTENLPLDFFILFSSFTSLIGTPGQANYVMGNAFLDNLAIFRRAKGLPALTVNWGAVSGAGFVAENPEVQKKLDLVGVKSLPFKKLLEILEKLLQHNAVQIGVAQIDWQRLGKIQKVEKISPRISHLVEIDLSDNSNAETVALLDTLMAIAPADRQQFLEKNISEQLAKVLGTSAAKLDKEKSLLNMGLDSLMAVEIGNRIQTSLSVNIPPVKFMEGITIKGMAEYIIQQLSDKEVETVVPDKPVLIETPLTEKVSLSNKPERILETVEAISDEEVDVLLNALLTEEKRNAEND